MSIGPISRRALTLCAAIALGVAPGVVAPSVAYGASAEKVSVAVGSFSGPGAKKARDKVLTVLRKSGSYVVTDAEDIKPGANQASYAKMATAMGASAILVGVISRRHNLTLTVYGGKGERVDSVEIKGGGGSFGLLKAIDNELEISIADPIARAKNPSAAKGGAAVAVGAGAGAGAAAGSAASKGKGKKNVEEEEPPVEEQNGAGAEEPAEPSTEGASESSEGASESSSSDVSVSDSASSGPGLRPLEVTAGVRFYHRSFTYTGEPLSPELHKYTLPLGPALLANLRIYPLAFLRNDAWSHIGIQGSFEYGIATSTQYSEAQPGGGTFTTGLKTSSSAYDIGLRGRFPLAAHELGVFLAFGAHSFILKGDETFAPPAPYALVPDVKYTFIRPGIDARLRFSKIHVGGHVAARFLQSMEDIDLDGVWFPGATGSGLDFGIDGGYQILKFLSIVAGGDFLQYGFDFNGMPPCPRPVGRCVIAGGATDTYFSGWVGAMLHIDGPPPAE